MSSRHDIFGLKSASEIAALDEQDTHRTTEGAENDAMRRGAAQAAANNPRSTGTKPPTVATLAQSLWNTADLVQRGLESVATLEAALKEVLHTTAPADLQHSTKKRKPGQPPTLAEAVEAARKILKWYTDDPKAEQAAKRYFPAWLKHKHAGRFSPPALLQFIEKTIGRDFMPRDQVVRTFVEIAQTASPEVDTVALEYEILQLHSELRDANKLALPPGVERPAVSIHEEIIAEQNRQKVVTVRNANEDVFVRAGHRLLRVGSGAWKTWIAGLTPKLPNESDLKKLELAARVRAAGSAPVEISVRVCYRDGAIFYDLGEHDTSRCVRITADGWDILEDPPSNIFFERPAGMKPAPEPQRGGKLDELRPLLNTDDSAWALTTIGLLAGLQPRGALPILNVVGPAGAAKSSKCHMLRRLIDPHATESQGLPGDLRNLSVIVEGQHISVWDNVSWGSVSALMADGICRIATGAGFAHRTLQSDRDRTFFNSRKMQIVNGLDSPQRGDVLDRCLTVSLNPVSDTQRKTDDEVDAAFTEMHPRLLGALFDAASAALRNLPNVHLPRKPRMANTACWAVAAEEALGFAPGTIMAALDASREAGDEEALDASPIAARLLELLRRKNYTAEAPWTGAASELITDLKPPYGERHPENWPKTAHHFTSALRRIVPNLLRHGVEVCFDRTNKKRVLSVWLLPTSPHSLSPVPVPVPVAPLNLPVPIVTAQPVPSVQPPAPKPVIKSERGSDLPPPPIPSVHLVGRGLKHASADGSNALAVQQLPSFTPPKADAPKHASAVPVKTLTSFNPSNSVTPLRAELFVDKSIEIDGVGMGVLSNGTRFLTPKPVAELAAAAALPPPVPAIPQPVKSVAVADLKPAPLSVWSQFVAALPTFSEEDTQRLTEWVQRERLQYALPEFLGAALAVYLRALDDNSTDPLSVLFEWRRTNLKPYPDAQRLRAANELLKTKGVACVA